MVTIVRFLLTAQNGHCNVIFMRPHKPRKPRGALKAAYADHWWPSEVYTSSWTAAASEGPEAAYGRREVQERVALLPYSKKAPHRFSLVMILRFFCGFTCKETGAIIGVSPATVRNVERKAMRYLKYSYSPAEWELELERL